MGWSRGYHYREGSRYFPQGSVLWCVFFQWFTIGGGVSLDGVFISLCGILTGGT